MLTTDLSATSGTCWPLTRQLRVGHVDHWPVSSERDKLTTDLSTSNGTCWPLTHQLWVGQVDHWPVNYERDVLTTDLSAHTAGCGWASGWRQLSDTRPPDAAIAAAGCSRDSRPAAPSNTETAADHHPEREPASGWVWRRSKLKKAKTRWKSQKLNLGF